MLLGVAIAALLTVVRHTRAEEEMGRRELIGSTVVGRHAALGGAFLLRVWLAWPSWWRSPGPGCWPASGTARLGPAAGRPSLRSPYALAWRLHRGTLLAWTAAFAVAGMVVGGAAVAQLGTTAGVDEARDLGLPQLQASVRESFPHGMRTALWVAAAAMLVGTRLACASRRKRVREPAAPPVLHAVDKVGQQSADRQHGQRMGSRFNAEGHRTSRGSGKLRFPGGAFGAVCLSALAPAH
ncbi:hypothetical protein ACFQ1L_34155 [Phytohabitans flavus]|uniref:hypothetical protein n=1 Tax=Phytohabitans flavus TaxID=1076124 RepID=UPI001563423C|nr:hypothetical protein [Phytohabitans flavus]